MSVHGKNSEISDFNNNGHKTFNYETLKLTLNPEYLFTCEWCIIEKDGYE